MIEFNKINSSVNYKSLTLFSEVNQTDFYGH